MRTKWLGCCGLLGFVTCLILLSPDPVDGQQPPGGFGGKGKGKKGGGDPSAYQGGQFGGGQYGGGQFGGGQPGGFGTQQVGGPGSPRGITMQFGGPGGPNASGSGPQPPGGDRGFGMGGPGMGKSGFGGPGMGKGGGDPADRADKSFSWFAAATGGQVIDMGKLEPESRARVRGVYEKYGLPPPSDNAVISRNQFVNTVGPAMAARSAMMGPGGFGGPGGRGGPGGPGGPGGFGDPNRSYNDPSNNWGSDPRDFGDRRDPNDPRGRDRKEEKKEPPVFAVRYGKLPDGLPLWWNDYDTNKDGQIGLHEWRLANEPTAKFYEMDLDGDGLLTPEEYLRYAAMKEEKEKVEALAKAAEEGIERPNRPSATAGEGRRPGGPSGVGGGPNPWVGGGKGGGKDDASQGSERRGKGDFMGKGDKGKGKGKGKGNGNGNGSD
jgi:hypothetical protein